MTGCLVQAQSYSNLRKKSIVVEDSIQLDTLSIVPGSEILRDYKRQIIHDSLYYINYSNSTLFLKNSTSYNGEIDILYRVFPYFFSYSYPNCPARESADTFLFEYLNQQMYSPINSLEEESSLLVNGNISRGMSAGNSQNVVVNSNLNLQLSGELSKGLFIEALLSDKNVPVQPNGYSQQVQEFDQVYIRIYDSVRSLQMGDVEIVGSNSHFLQFNRRILGGNFINRNMQLNSGATANMQVSGAISKGKFNRSVFVGIEGIQGPYPLHGANNETYIIILAGTERVYLDGVLLERGEDADYVINYNTAELIFTVKHFITKDSRVIAEYEYSDKNYNRFLFYAQGSVKKRGGAYTVQYFSESDAKNQPVNQLLTDSHRQILAEAGDDPFNAIVPNYDSVAFDKNRVLYKMVDTVVNSVIYDSILVYSTNPDSAYYQASFALVGDERGSYIQDITSANGKVFRWVAPINGVMQGNYEPVQLLIPPQMQRVMVLASEYDINSRTKVSVEFAAW